MKILLVNTNYHPNIYGGAETSVQHLAESLVRLGHRVVVVALGESKQRANVSGVTVYYLPLFNVFLPADTRPPWPARVLWNMIDIRNHVMAVRLGEVIREERPDVVHTNVLQGFSVSVWPEIKRHGIPLVHTLRDHLLLCPRSTMFKRGANCQAQCITCKVFSLGKKRAARHIDTVVGISKFILDRHLGMGWFRGLRQAVVPNSFHASQTTARREVIGPVRFGFIGRLTEGKGIELLIRCFNDLQATNARLVIAGAGHNAYVKHLKDLAADDRIEFLGYSSRTKFYSQVDAVVVPSIHNEALGRSILEAYAFGRPVIASSRGGMPEIIDSGRTGFVFDPDEPARLLEILRRVVSRPGILSELTGNCIAKSREFDEPVIAAQYIQVYESLLSSREPALASGAGEAV